MNKIISFQNKMLLKKGMGSPVLLNEESNEKIGEGISNVLTNDRKDDLIIGSGVILNKPNDKIIKKPLKLNL